MSQTTQPTAHDPEKLDRRIGENSRLLADALSRIKELESVVEEQQQLIEDLRHGTVADDYEGMSARERRLRVKQALRKKAENQNGAAAMDYREIVAEFDQEIPNATAYKLMEQIPTENEAFQYEERGNGNNRLTYDRERDTAVFTSE